MSYDAASPVPSTGAGHNNESMAEAVQEEDEEDIAEAAEEDAVDAAIDAAVVAQNPTAPSNVDHHEHDSVTVGTSGVSLTAAVMAAEEAAEEVEEAFRPRVLVVDDSAMNRRMLCRRCVRALPMTSPQPLSPPRLSTSHTPPPAQRPHSLLTSVTPVYTNHAALLASLELAGFDTVQADDGLTACAAVSHVDVVRRIGDSKHGTIDHPDAPVAGEDAAPRPALDPFVAILMDSNMPIMVTPRPYTGLYLGAYLSPYLDPYLAPDQTHRAPSPAPLTVTVYLSTLPTRYMYLRCSRDPTHASKSAKWATVTRSSASPATRKWKTSSVRVPTGSCSSP